MAAGGPFALAAALLACYLVATTRGLPLEPDGTTLRDAGSLAAHLSRDTSALDFSLTQRPILACVAAQECASRQKSGVCCVHYGLSLQFSEPHRAKTPAQLSLHEIHSPIFSLPAVRALPRESCMRSHLLGVKHSRP